MLTFFYDENHLTLKNGKEKLSLAWPAVAVSISGIRYEAITAASKPVLKENSLVQKFCNKDLEFEVKLTNHGTFLRKELVICSEKDFPTPDYVEVDAQFIPNEKFVSCGYRSTAKKITSESAEEEGKGLMPGCGYPLIGKKIFVGLEHPAAFNLIKNDSDNEDAYYLRHFPQWKNGVLESVTAALGWSDEPEKLFAQYLEQIRLPSLKKPLFSFNSFWSDPYLGNYEYDIREENYRSLLNEFQKLGLKPDVFTFDAGWQNRQSFYEAKSSFGGEVGLKKLSEEFKQNGIGLGLWVSHNGPMGICNDFLRASGYAVGGGVSAAYSGDNYAVLLDDNLEKKLCEAFCRLAGEGYDCLHFKIDWDNDCATNDQFKERFPTVNHVRQSSIDAMSRIADKMREVNPSVVIRNGWWPSPWWLTRVNHVFLTDSGDSEYASLPSCSQRDSAMTHRDLMYHSILRRDKSQMPLDCFDNHDFAQALRNPFYQDEGTWSDYVWFSIMKGSSYFPYTLQPGSLEKTQVEVLAHTMEFVREYSDKLISSKSRMVLGAPGKGEIYGFLFPAEDNAWLALRNPLPVPQKFLLKSNKLCDFKVKSLNQFYPDFRALKPDQYIYFLPGEVKLLQFDSAVSQLPFSIPFQIKKNEKNSSPNYYFPASSQSTLPKVYQVPELALKEEPKLIEEKDFSEINFALRIPYKMRRFQIYMMFLEDFSEQTSLKLFCSRYSGASLSSYALPLTEIPWGIPGNGERKNPDQQPKQNCRYFMADIPQGGETYIKLKIENSRCKVSDLKIWAAGYEAATNSAKIQEEKILNFKNTIPAAHPMGFPKIIEIL